MTSPTVPGAAPVASMARTSNSIDTELSPLLRYAIGLKLLCKLRLSHAPLSPFTQLATKRQFDLDESRFFRRKPQKLRHAAVFPSQGVDALFAVTLLHEINSPSPDRIPETTTHSSYQIG